MSVTYNQFLEAKRHVGCDHGFDPVYMPDFLFPFQRSLVEWAVRKGRAAIFADCGLGKTPMQLVWADNVRRKTGKPVLIVTPLAVAQQTEREAAKFGIAAARCQDGVHNSPIVITNSATSRTSSSRPRSKGRTDYAHPRPNPDNPADRRGGGAGGAVENVT